MQHTSHRLISLYFWKSQLDSDEEAEEAAAAENRKRWRRKRNEPPKRQWVLQEQVEFLETMMAKRQKKHEVYPAGKLSSRYEGLPEHNPSHYVVMDCRSANHHGTNGNDNNDHTIQVTLLPAPPNATVTFAQPAARKALSMNEAEQAIQDQRNNITRYMMHNKQNSILNQAAKPVNQSKARLLGKLQKANQKVAGEDNDEADDIMADVAFRDRKGNTKARKELLTSLGDELVKVDDDGVLGGAHDDEFGGKRHFGAFKVSSEEKKQAGGDDQGKAEKGNAGMAMEDGFYQRDVKAEYDELDYDIEEQFDDDDVDHGETEVVVDGEFAQEDDDDDDEDADEDMEEGGGQISGAEGLASVAGFKALLAKARGETTEEDQAAAAAANGTEAGSEAGKQEDAKKRQAARPKPQSEADKRLENLFKAAETFQAKTTNTSTPKVEPKKIEETSGAVVGPDGLRIVSLEAVRKEIWLNHGSIPMKRLMKLFDIKKKSSVERQNKFREVVKELCIMKTDPVGGRMLVLKQHYSNMG